MDKQSHSGILNNFFSNSYYEIEQFAFKDQTIVKPNFSQHLNAANNMIQAMSVFGAETMDNGQKCCQQFLLIPY